MVYKAAAVRIAVSAVIALSLYLLFWPIPIEPVAYRLPTNTGLVDPYAPNDRLRRAQVIGLNDYHGPEDATLGPDGRIYTGTRSGEIISFDTNGRRHRVFASVGGRPLGLEFDAAGNLYVANAFAGIQKIDPQGQATVLVNEFDGKPLQYVNDLAVAGDGTVYFSESSTRFGASFPGETYAAAVLDIWEHSASGRVFRLDPVSGEIAVILDGLSFANGVALSIDQRYLLVAETGSYRILRHWLHGPAATQTEVLISNLPGAPDNINTGLSGKFWLGLIAPRNESFDAMSEKPWLRKIMWRLPEMLKPAISRYSHVLAISGDGDILMNLQDTSGQLTALTGVLETTDSLWLCTLFGNEIGKLAKRDLSN